MYFTKKDKRRKRPKRNTKKGGKTRTLKRTPLQQVLALQMADISQGQQDEHTYHANRQK